MKNIYLYNKISKQNQLEVDQLQINQELKLNGADPNKLLITDTNSNVVTFNNAPAHYIMEIDPNSLIPAWTNNITVDDITTNTMTINNTQQADLLTIGDGIGSVDRLPRGLNKQFLISDDLTFGLNWKYLKDVLNISNPGKIFFDGTKYYTDTSAYNIANNLVFSGSTLLNSITKATVSGRTYKLTMSLQNVQTSGNNNYTINIAGQASFTITTYATGSQENYTTVFTSNINGSTLISVYGVHLPNPDIGASTNCLLLCECIL